MIPFGGKNAAHPLPDHLSIINNQEFVSVLKFFLLAFFHMIVRNTVAVSFP
jgi:hypothetical protein